MNSRKLSKSTKTNAQFQNKKTLDMQHAQFMTNLEETKRLIDTYTEDIHVLEKEIESFSKKKKEGLIDDKDIDKNIERIDKKIQLKKDLERLKEKYNEDSYLTDNSDILFKYYDLVENGNITSENIVEPKTPNSILNFFNKSRKEENPDIHVEKPQNEKNKITKSALLNNYLSNVDKEKSRDLPIQSQSFCPHCFSKRVALMSNDGYVLCQDCNAIEHVIIDHEKPSYKDPPKEISYFCYKRGNHLNEWISQIQGKETTEIPDEVYDKILLEFKKQRISNMASLCPLKLRQILKKLELNKYYEHVPHIIFRMNGISNPNLEPELEEKIRNMFKQVQGPFLQFSPKGRKNFLSYSYVLHKFFQLLEKDHLLPSVGLLKSRDKLMQQDIIWKKICESLNWEFIPSL